MRTPILAVSVLVLGVATYAWTQNVELPRSESVCMQALMLPQIGEKGVPRILAYNVDVHVYNMLVARSIVIEGSGCSREHRDYMSREFEKDKAALKAALAQLQEFADQAEFLFKSTKMEDDRPGRVEEQQKAFFQRGVDTIQKAEEKAKKDAETLKNR